MRNFNRIDSNPDNSFHSPANKNESLEAQCPFTFASLALVHNNKAPQCVILMTTLFKNFRLDLKVR